MTGLEGTRRVAAIDCGTNSIRLLVADVDSAAGTLRDVCRLMEVVRLGQGVDATGRIAPEALRRTLDATARYAALISEYGAGPVRFVATSATRDAANRDEFTAGVKALLGVAPEVVPGAVEAQLSFAGAARELRGRHPAPYLVVDLGGGSTEFVLGAAAPDRAVSVDVGCVRLTERHRGPGAAGAVDLAGVRADVLAALDRAAETVPFDGVATLVGLAGTVTTVTACALGLPAYDSTAIHGTVLGVDAVRAAAERLTAATAGERAAMPFMHPGRVDVIGTGALIWQLIVERVAARSGITTVVTSEHDILDGIAWSLVPG